MSPSCAATRAGNCGSGQQSALKGKPPLGQSGRRRTGTSLPAGAGRSPSRYAEPRARICSEDIGKRHLPGKSRPADTRLIRSTSNAADEMLRKPASRRCHTGDGTADRRRRHGNRDSKNCAYPRSSRDRRSFSRVGPRRTHHIIYIAAQSRRSATHSTSISHSGRQTRASTMR